MVREGVFFNSRYGEAVELAWNDYVRRRALVKSRDGDARAVEVFFVQKLLRVLYLYAALCA